jgi:hypothetical protein
MAYKNKTQETDEGPENFLQKNFPADNLKQYEAKELIKFYEKVSGFKCVMWNKIFGFGKYFYKDSGGGDHEYLMCGFAISKSGLTLYDIMGWENYKKDLEGLGKYKFSGKSCLAIKSIKDIDLKILEKVVYKSLADMKKKYQNKNGDIIIIYKNN